MHVMACLALVALARMSPQTSPSTAAPAPPPKHVATATAPAADPLDPGTPPADPAARMGWIIARVGNGRGSTPCSICHGMDGSGRRESGVPRLAGQDRAYLVKQLTDFHSGTRHHFTMQPVALSLSESDIAAVAAYYSSLPPAEVTPSAQATELLALGWWIAERGIFEKGVASCNSCHGADGAGVAPLFPRLQGQSATYMRTQLGNLATGERGNDPAGMMRGIAARLSPEEIRAVAAYYESLGLQRPGATAPAQAKP